MSFITRSDTKSRWFVLVAMIFVMAVNAILVGVARSLNVSMGRELIEIVLVNVFFAVLYPVVLWWTKFSERFSIFQLESTLAPALVNVLLVTYPIALVVAWVGDLGISKLYYFLPWFLAYLVGSLNLKKDPDR